MGLAAGAAPDLGNAIPADAHNTLAALRRKVILIVLRLPHLLSGLVELDLAALRAAVDLHLQGTGQDVGPVSRKETGLSKLDLFPLEKPQLSAAVSTFDGSHSACSTAAITPLTPVVSTVSIRPLS